MSFSFHAQIKVIDNALQTVEKQQLRCTDEERKSWALCHFDEESTVGSQGRNPTGTCQNFFNWASLRTVILPGIRVSC